MTPAEMRHELIVLIRGMAGQWELYLESLEDGKEWSFDDWCTYNQRYPEASDYRSAYDLAPHIEDLLKEQS